MPELARGDITDRPWGLTLGALGLRGLTGHLVLADEGYTLGFHQGAVVSAVSRHRSDAVARIAATNALITPSQAAEAQKRLAAHPERDELAVVVELAKLSADQTDRLRRRVIAQRTARTFSLERGAFVVDDVEPADTSSAVDIRPIIYLGAHAHMSDERLTVALAGLGTHFHLKPEAKDDVARFGFTDAEREVIATLAEGATIPALEAAHPRVDRRSLLAIVYALVSALACEITTNPAEARTKRPRTRGKASIAPQTAPAEVHVSFKKPTGKKPKPIEAKRKKSERLFVPDAELDADLDLAFQARDTKVQAAVPDPDEVLELEDEAPTAPLDVESRPPARSGRRTDQLMAWVVVPRAPAPKARPDTLDDAPLASIDKSKRARTPTPFGPLMQPRRPAKS